MLSVDELLAQARTITPTKAQAADGHLVVTSEAAFLCQSKDDDGPGILVYAKGLTELLSETISPQAGSIIYDSGAATVRGKFGANGIPCAPLIVRDLEEVSLTHESGLVAVYVAASEPSRAG